MLIFKYLATEVLKGLLALIIIILLIFISTQFVQYLNRAASGQFPLIFVLKILLLEIPDLTTLLLPLGYYTSLLITYGRLYSDNEMIALKAGGYSPGLLLTHSFAMPVVLAILTILLSNWVNPYLAALKQKTIRTTGVKVVIQTMVPGQFKVISDGRDIVYVESMNKKNKIANNVFIAHLKTINSSPEWDVIWAKNIHTGISNYTHNESVIAEDGTFYKGTPEKSDYEIASFKHYESYIKSPSINVYDNLSTRSLSQLWKDRSNPHVMTQIQWRFSPALMIFVLTLIAVPLSRCNPRTGKFAKLVPAILIYTVYANLIYIGASWIRMNIIPMWLGLWWIHLIFAILGGMLFWNDRVKLK